MKKINKKVWLHLGMIILMFAVACVYFSPVLDGKIVRQGDTEKFEAMVKSTKDYHAKTGDYTYWNDNLFSGMPSYQVGASKPPQTIATPLRNIVNLHYLGWERNIGILFLYLIGFYVAMVVLGVSPWLALFGALGFGLGSYNIIIVEAGHISKAWAIAMMAPIFAGMILCFRKKRDTDKNKIKDFIIGSVLFTTALILQLNFNHIQITYYTVIGCAFLGLAHLIYAIIGKYIKSFSIGLGILLVGAAIAFGCNARTLLTTQQYAKQTMRGGNAITVTPEDLYHDEEPESISGKKSGLNLDYAFMWSYGKGETYTLLVPGAMGGGSSEKVGRDSETYKNFRQDVSPLYWGNQPFTSGPVYLGAIMMFLALLGLILIKGPERWWLLAVAIVGVLMSWGNNFLLLNEWLFNHLPLYNKFRTPSMSLVITSVAVAMLGILGLKQLFSDDVSRKFKNIALYVSAGVTLLTIVVVLIMSSGFSYSGLADEQMSPQYGDQWARIQEIFIKDRAALFKQDSWRSFIFILLSAAMLWFYVNVLKKAKYGVLITTTVLMILVVADLWGVDRRYLNEKNFVKATSAKLIPDQWDNMIDKMAEQQGDKDYRVLNLAVNTFNDSRPSAFHAQVGGYSAVKMRRYQDLIDFYMGRHINPTVINMLNARYIVLNNGQLQRNPDALGNAWFVNECKTVDDANAEILALNDFDPKTTAIVDKCWSDKLKGYKPQEDSLATIVLEHQSVKNPSYLKYTTHSAVDQLAVFSEIYYEPDWKAYIDGKPADYFRANYVLRAMIVPAGDHEIEFRNEAPLAKKMDTLSLIVSIVFVLIVAGTIVLYIRQEKKAKKSKEVAGK